MNQILIVGVGGAGCEMAAKVHSVVGGRVVALNTDRKALEQVSMLERLVLGPKSCQGASAKVPSRGRRAAEESLEELVEILRGSTLLILLAGLGAGLGRARHPLLCSLPRTLG